MKQESRPEIGTKMYFVVEHLYYDKTIRTAPFTEYCVCEGEISRFLTVRYTEMELRGKNPDGHGDLHYYRLEQIGKKVFYSVQEAAQLAKEMTEKYERIWGWFGPPDIPMRRPWESLLEGKAK